MVRTTRDIANRALALHALVACSFGFDKSAAISWCKKEGVITALTESELKDLESNSADMDQYQCYVEALYAFVWVLGRVDKLDFNDHCPEHMVGIYPDLLTDESAVEFIDLVNIQSKQKVLEACDLAYCIHWALRDIELNGGARYPNGIEPYVVVERRRVLEWLLSEESWDEISLDT